MEEKQVDVNTLFEMYWTYYSLHSEQRMKILELFITLEIVLYGGFAVMLEKNSFFAVLAAGATVLVAFLCYILDKRTTDLLHHCRVSIRALEEHCMDGYEEKMRLFSNVKTKEGKINFSKIIRLVYVLVSIIGCGLLIFVYKCK